MWQIKENLIPYGTALANETIIYNVVKEDMRPDSLKATLLADLPVKDKTTFTKSESHLLTAKMHIDLSLTPNSRDRKIDKLKEIRRPKNTIGKLVNGNHQKKQSKSYQKKLFSSNIAAKSRLQSDESEDDVQDLFPDSEFFMRSFGSEVLLENRYVEMYRNCWSRDKSCRYEAIKTVSVIEDLLSML